MNQSIYVTTSKHTCTAVAIITLFTYIALHLRNLHVFIRIYMDISYYSLLHDY